MNFSSNLPFGFKEECSNYAVGPLKSISIETLLADIRSAAGSEEVDARAIARLFWLFLEGELHEGTESSKGILRRVLEELPHSMGRSAPTDRQRKCLIKQRKISLYLSKR